MFTAPAPVAHEQINGSAPRPVRLLRVVGFEIVVSVELGATLAVAMLAAAPPPPMSLALVPPPRLPPMVEAAGATTAPSCLMARRSADGSTSSAAPEDSSASWARSTAPRSSQRRRGRCASPWRPVSASGDVPLERPPADLRNHAKEGPGSRGRGSSSELTVWYWGTRGVVEASL